ncbi:hypothetical protein F5X68DRAFT_235218 [Plectosphaerella plurivora]|uniref:Uncharacterized protein n=1 Tax=Plectosphaerella plurivora TaxID=936078 RepID=A0A9P8V6X8_9PEZI|nr:hypothetical protein F5X68DRAFT_235218 [Plectosphaerella plurivora]
MTEEAPPTPNIIHSFEWNTDHGIWINSSPHLLRLRWRAWQPIEAIREFDEDDASIKRLYGHHTHLIAAGPLTQPPISSMNISLDQFYLWEESWEIEHDRHGEWDDKEVMETFGTRMVALSRDEREWGRVKAYAEEAGLDVHADDFVVTATRRMRCCGFDWPMSQEDMPRVRLTGTGEGVVITIGDWVACVHAMLEQYHEELLQARAMRHADAGEVEV